MNKTRNGIRIKKAKRARNGVGFVAGYYVNGEIVEFGWGLTREEAKRDILAKAEAAGLVTNGVDCNV